MKLGKVLVLAAIFLMASRLVVAQQCLPDGTSIGSYKGTIAHSCGIPNGGNPSTKHQCTEFVREFCAVNFFHDDRKFGITYAQELFDKGPELGFSAYSNGGSTAPQPDDILCYSGGQSGYGHVAIIMEVNDNSIKIIDENRSCSSAYATLTKSGNYLYNNLDGYQIQGWLRYGQTQPTNFLGLKQNNERDQRVIDFYNTHGGASTFGQVWGNPNSYLHLWPDHNDIWVQNKI